MERKKNTTLIREALGYYTGEAFWSESILPRLEEKTESETRIMERVKRLFMVSNKCKEVVKRHRSALYGNAPSWSILDSNGDRVAEDIKTRLSRAIAQMQAQWIRMSIGRYPHHTDSVSKAIDDLLTTGYGYLRLWSPAKFANNPDSVRRVGLHSPEVESVEIINDNDGLPEKCFYFFEKEGKTFAEVQEINERGLTIFHWEDEKGNRIPMDDSGTEEFSIDLGGRFTIFEMRRSPLIDDTVMRAQNAINHALTMVPTNVEYSGFLLQVVSNGLPPGKYEDGEDGSQVFVPSGELLFAPGATNFINGIPQYDQLGNITGYTTPKIDTHDPTSIQPLVDTYKLFCSVIYEHVHQGHMLSNDLSISGISRQQLKADFKSSLALDKMLVEAILGDLLTTALLMANTGKTYTVAVDLSIDLGAPSTEERKDIRENFASGLLSQETAIALQGYVDSADIESELIAQEARKNTTANSKIAARDIIDLENISSLA
jgi:hypothetical protein